MMPKAVSKILSATLEVGDLQDETALRDLFALRESYDRIGEKFAQQTQILILQTTTGAGKTDLKNEAKEVASQCSLAEEEITNLIAQVKVNRSLNKTEELTINQPDFSVLINALTDNINEQKKQREADSENMKQFFRAQEEQMKLMLPSGGPAIVEEVERIKLPQFSGDYLEWKSFHDVYVSVVHSNRKFSNIQKMNYLKSALKGDAALVISHLTICEENYNVAWSAILRHYNDKRSMVAAHIDTFMKQSSVSQPSAAAIKRLQTTSSCVIQTLDSLSVSQKDPWIINHVLSKLDPETKSLWAREKFDDIPSWTQFEEFLINRWRELEQYALFNPKLSGNQGKNSNNCDQKHKSDKKKLSSHTASKQETQSLCPYCQKSPHKLYRCKTFIALPISKRIEAVRSLSFCPNCLSEKHSIESCKYQSCKLCNQKHNRLLHESQIASGPVESHSRGPPDSNAPPLSANTSYQFNPNTMVSSTPASYNCVDDDGRVNSRVLLATAMVLAYDIHNQPHACRMLLDAGSQVNFVTTSLCQDLRLKQSTANLTIEGVGSATQYSRYTTTLRISPLHGNSNEVYSLECAVLRRVTSEQPNWNINLTNIHIPQNYQLADPQWHVTRPIDILVGAALFFEIVGGQILRLGEGLPILRDSTLGWLVVGSIDQPQFATSNSSYQTVVCNTTSVEQLDASIRKFWVTESLPTQTVTEIEHQEVEELFSSTTTRSDEGRYVVHFPLNDNVSNLGSNHRAALRQFYSLESRMRNHYPDLHDHYSQIFEEYLAKGIIEKVPHEEIHNPSFYMPYHCVIKKDARSTKYRFVFNCSAKSETGFSLNDCLKIGAVVQPPLYSVLLRFRRFPFAVTSDIVKMYLQILLHLPHKDLLRFLWQSKTDKCVQSYRFRTICFGASASPFLATRVLAQLAADEGDKFPLAASVLTSNCYVDDCLLSVPTVEEAIETMKQLTAILKSAVNKKKKKGKNDNEEFENIDPAKKDEEMELTVPKAELSGALLGAELCFAKSTIPM
ncbi:uncharacterized protein LOC129791560 [Lutzomyia longipalpis]|uniref:uncharacterized protein LOC129791560 n=1 Tax=Lutzomyia longipalpis TaxID=7200 RepID=UPI0024837CD7|nr:uncharacterized protein LOC129791560 [Lutzomyia longipalpis]